VARIEAYLNAKFRLDPSNRFATVHERYRQTGQTDRQRTDSIGRTILQTVAQKPFWSLKMKANFDRFGDINGCIPQVAVAVYIKLRDITRDASLTYFDLN